MLIAGTLAAGTVLVVAFIVTQLAGGSPRRGSVTLRHPGAYLTTTTSIVDSTTTVATSSTVVTAPPPNLSVGQASTFVSRTGPQFSIALTQVADPAQPSDSASSTAPGSRLVAFLFTIDNTGAKQVGLDATWAFRLYDSQGNGYASEAVGVTAGPPLPGGVKLDGGATVSGWVVFALPQSATLGEILFTPGFGYNEFRALWTVAG